MRHREFKFSNFEQAKTHSPVTRISHKHVESLLQSYSLLLAEKFATLLTIVFPR